MISALGSEYNRDQYSSLTAILEVLRTLTARELESLRNSALPYLRFRRTLDAFQAAHIDPFCKTTCFDTDLSLCCGFESIFTFFADQVIALLFSREEEIAAMIRVLERPNRSGRCVYLGKAGCLMGIRPVSCAMFFCDKVKHGILSDPLLEEHWKRLKQQEEEFTYPVKPVLFDEMEAFFMARGVDSPHMYYHKSPGLMRLKRKFGVGSGRFPAP